MGTKVENVKPFDCVLLLTNVAALVRVRLVWASVGMVGVYSVVASHGNSSNRNEDPIL